MPIFRTEHCLAGWGKEAEFGIAVVPNQRFGIHEIVNAPDPELDWYPFFGVSSGRSRQTIMRGKHTLRGGVPDIRIRQGDALGELLAMGVGRYEGGYVLEGRSATDERLDSLTMQVAMRDTDGNYSLIRDYYGGKVNRMTLACAEGEELRLTLDEIIFKDIAHSIPGHAKEGTPSLMSDPGPHAGGRFLFAGATVSVFGVQLCRIRRLSLTVDNQIEPRYYLCKIGGNPNGDQSQVVTELIEGRRRYAMEIDLDVADPATDLQLFKFLMDEGALSGDRFGTSGPTIGGQVVANFAVTPGEGSGSLIITAGGTPTPVNPAAVVTGGKINVPAPPTGLFPSSWALDVNSIQIQIP